MFRLYVTWTEGRKITAFIDDLEKYVHDSCLALRAKAKSHKLNFSGWYWTDDKSEFQEIVIVFLGQLLIDTDQYLSCNKKRKPVLAFKFELILNMKCSAGRER